VGRAFVFVGRAGTIRLSFGRGATIADAKAAVAAEMDADIADVGLAFSGKLLKEQLLLERVARGESPMAFSIADRRPVELFTCRAQGR
jgi:hypothetical protein